ncbi:MAG: hypothetical protein ACREP9_09310 [Candidatus Dormibacteraceae bacterium]
MFWAEALVTNDPSAKTPMAAILEIPFILFLLDRVTDYALAVTAVYGRPARWV